VPYSNPCLCEDPVDIIIVDELGLADMVFWNARNSAFLHNPKPSIALQFPELSPVIISVCAARLMGIYGGTSPLYLAQAWREPSSSLKANTRLVSPPFLRLISAKNCIACSPYAAPSNSRWRITAFVNWAVEAVPPTSGVKYRFSISVVNRSL